MIRSVSFRHSARTEFIEAAAWYESERQNLGVDESLETLLNMMSTFVDLAWGTNSVQTVLKTERPSSPQNLQPMAQRTSNPRKTGKRRRI
jgi:hypothetical protein